MKIKAIFFDADHTLYEIPEDAKKKAYEKFFSFLSEELKIEREILEKAFFEILEKVKKSKNPEKRRREYCLRKVLKKLHADADKSIIHEALKIFWNAIIENIKPKRGVLKFVQEMQKHHSLGIFTDEFYEIVEKKLEKIFGNREKYFRFLITPEITGEMKPSPKFYEKILELTKLKPEEILVVGDSWERDLALAKKFGMKTALIAVSKEGEPDFFARDFEEFRNLFK